MEVVGQRHATAALLPQERPCTLCVGGWVRSQTRNGRALKISPRRHSFLQNIQPVAGRYTV